MQCPYLFLSTTIVRCGPLIDSALRQWWALSPFVPLDHLFCRRSLAITMTSWIDCTNSYVKYDFDGEFQLHFNFVCIGTRPSFGVASAHLCRRCQNLFPFWERTNLPFCLFESELFATLPRSFGFLNLVNCCGFALGEATWFLNSIQPVYAADAAYAALAVVMIKLII